MRRLSGKVALVTGGASGIGCASALALAEDGATVMIADVDLARGEAVAAEIAANGGSAGFIGADVTVEAEVAALVRRVVEEHGRLDCAHNNVGLGSSGPTILDQTEEDWDWTFGMSLKSTWLAMKHEIPAMRAAGGGAIVNTASMAGVICTPAASPAYSAAKAGVIHLTRYAAHAYAAQGIRVNSISPGLVATPQIAAMLTEAEQSAIAGAHQLIDRALRPSEVADAVVYLCSDRSAMVTGVNLEVCGGGR